MKTSPRFDRAVSALVGAYLNDTLEETNCKACAVGNIVAAGYGAKVYKKPDGNLGCDVPNDKWASIFVSGAFLWNPESDHRYAKGLENIAKTGYSADELRRVEDAFMSPFEHGYCQSLEEDTTYGGLMACIDVLCQIEGIPDAAPYKAQFDKSLPLEIA